MAESFLSPGALWDEMLPSLQRLPEGRLQRADLISPDFLLAEEGRLTVYWIPFERLNPSAKVVIAGLTPGYGQMEEAFAAARDAVRAGRTTAETLAHVKRCASFAGSMRINMVRMFDSVGLAKALGIGSSAELFGEYARLVHTTSALRYPVFIDGRNYGGANPEVGRSALLTSYVRGLLGPELLAVPSALVVPLGKAAEHCVRLLVGDGAIHQERCLFGFPHPSGGNGHRVRQFRENEVQLKQEILDWSSTP